MLTSRWNFLHSGLFVLLFSGALLGLTDHARALTPAPVAAPASQYQVLAANDLGMHCYDADFSVFSILPPFNVLHAQVIAKGRQPKLLGPGQVTVYYSGITDLTGSINTMSGWKTNFWTYVKPLYGASPGKDVGLLGYVMPCSGNTPRRMGFDAARNWFLAAGVPITNLDNKGKTNPYPLLRITAKLAGQTAAASTLDVVVPASSEMNCAACHATGALAAGAYHAQRYRVTFSSNPNPALQYRENVLRLHDAVNKTTLFASRPVLCASCHYSRALDLAGTGPSPAQKPHRPMSLSMHRHHGMTLNHTMPSATNPAILPDAGASSCYQCHPGTITNCLRGAMSAAQIQCQDCHGGMLSVGGVYALKSGVRRQPWADLPKCQSCHLGDELNHTGGTGSIVKKAYSATDPGATPTLAANTRFAENTSKLYRFSTGHGGVTCEGCHGSPHAEWPARLVTANDNITATEIQGHTGSITECNACHDDALPATMAGPHGMHNVGSSWVSAHSDFLEQTSADCRSCHGLRLEGTALARAATDRTFTGPEGQQVKIAKGTMVACAICHGSGGGQKFLAKLASRR